MLRLFSTILFTSLCATAFAQPPAYHVVKSFSIASPGGWDYIALNPVNGNIYVSHSTQVNVLDSKTGDSVGYIPNTEGVHGIAFAPVYNKGFTSNGRSNSVTVFDINTNKELARIATGENPDAIMYDSFSKMMWVCEGRGKSLSAIDPATNKVVKSIPLPGKPETAVSDNAGKLYINIEDKNEIVSVNATTFTIEKTWPLGKGESPTGLAIDTKTNRLFAGCDGRLIVLNAENGAVVKDLPIGDGCDGVAFDPELKYIFTANGIGTLTIIKETTANNFEVAANIPTQKGARTLTLVEKTHTLYLPTAEYDTAKPAAPHTRPGIVPGTFKILVVGQ